jgi:hypothetical protein
MSPEDEGAGKGEDKGEDKGAGMGTDMIGPEGRSAPARIGPF